MADTAILDRIVRTQERNALLHGEALTTAAGALVEQALRANAEVVAADEAGERLIGAAAVLRPSAIRPVNTTATLTGRTVLLVSGAIAAPVALSQHATRLRSLGAAYICAAVLDGWEGDVPGCDGVVNLPGRPSPSTHTRVGHASRGAAA